jgi:putative tryptophan/tyrosine transport system substrate-binding protein
MIHRRAFVTGLGALLAAPLGAWAQQAGKVDRVGVLFGGAPGSDLSAVQGLEQGLRELGQLENKTIVIEYRYADGQLDRVPGFIAELINLKMDVLVTAGTRVTAVAKRETTTMPIVCVTGDPVRAGLVQSLARPGGNITGASFASSTAFSGKWLELAREAVPKASLVGYMWNPENRSSANLTELKALAAGLHLQVTPYAVQRTDDIEAALIAMRKSRIGALIADIDATMLAQRARITSLAATGQIPTIFGLREFVDAGGLMSYGPSLRDLYRRAASQVAKILKGASPTDLPIEQSTKFELVINLKTAKALGLTIPPSLLLRADQIID